MTQLMFSASDDARHGRENTETNLSQLNDLVFRLRLQVEGVKGVEAQWALKRLLESASSYAASRLATDATTTARSLEGATTITSRRQSLDNAEVATAVQSIQIINPAAVRSRTSRQPPAIMIILRLEPILLLFRQRHEPGRHHSCELCYHASGHR